ncbi:hypothetical protein CQW23_23968 [Capsicum baccatum]|uniref:Ubiquitin-like protease family profile domain-containing protein n=1 Tax=Capsicum baccatum TaxID=33114 RepID=A0A2G2VTG9_CAPBA|nr:hypothetical protein CQW23_23968 [Capsicum baccatum]
MNVEIDSQQLIPDELLRSINMDYLHSEKVAQHDCRISDEKIDEIILSDLQFTIPDEMLPSLNTHQIKRIIMHPSATRQEEHEILDAKTSATVIEDHAQRDEQLWPDSQNTIPDEFLASLNVYDQTSIMIHPSANCEVKNPRTNLRIRQRSKFKESPYTKKFGSAAGISTGLIHIFAQKHPFLYHLIDVIIDTKIVNNFKDWISVDLLKASVKSGHYVVVLVEIDKIAKIIPLCLQACDFYVKKGIDLQNHPRYKDKESSDMFDFLFEDDLPQQPSGSLDCGVFMVMYAECLSYGHKVIATEFDPNSLRTRYTALL